MFFFFLNTQAFSWHSVHADQICVSLLDTCTLTTKAMSSGRFIPFPPLIQIRIAVGLELILAVMQGVQVGQGEHGETDKH